MGGEVTGQTTPEFMQFSIPYMGGIKYILVSIFYTTFNLNDYTNYMV